MRDAKFSSLYVIQRTGHVRQRQSWGKAESFHGLAALQRNKRKKKQQAAVDGTARIGPEVDLTAQKQAAEKELPDQRASLET